MTTYQPAAELPGIVGARIVEAHPQEAGAIFERAVRVLGIVVGRGDGQRCGRRELELEESEGEEEQHRDGEDCKSLRLAMHGHQ